MFNAETTSVSEMIAIEITRPGGPEVLVLTKRPVPRPNADEVLIRIHAAGVNGPDVFQRKGQYNPPPGASDILGLEIAGEVVEGARTGPRNGANYRDPSRFSRYITLRQ